MIKRLSKQIITFFALVGFLVLPGVGLASGVEFLSAEENAWLEDHQNTIFFYPEENDPPLSYISPAGKVQGLSIDYMTLIAEKLDIRVIFSDPLPKSEIVKKIGDDYVGVMSGMDSEGVGELSITEPYTSLSTVIVARKDIQGNDFFSLDELSGKTLAVVSGSALESYIAENYPSVYLKSFVDDEVCLQQVVLGEADAAAIDMASLSFYLFQQILSSVGVVGNVDFDYQPAFVVNEDNAVLKSILEKTMNQVTPKERSALSAKWINLPSQNYDGNFFNLTGKDFNLDGVYLVFSSALIFVILLIIQGPPASRRSQLKDLIEEVKEMKEDVEHLEEDNQKIFEELKKTKQKKGISAVKKKTTKTKKK